MASCEMTVMVTNHDELLSGAEVIIEAGYLLSLPSYLIRAWVEYYIRHNIKIKVT
jgi:hypothetical protein